MSAYLFASPSCLAVVLSWVVVLSLFGYLVRIFWQPFHSVRLARRFLLPVCAVRFSRRFQWNAVFASISYSRSEVSHADLFIRASRRGLRTTNYGPCTRMLIKQAGKFFTAQQTREEVFDRAWNGHTERTRQLFCQPSGDGFGPRRHIWVELFVELLSGTPRAPRAQVPLGSPRLAWSPCFGPRQFPFPRIRTRRAAVLVRQQPTPLSPSCWATSPLFLRVSAFLFSCLFCSSTCWIAGGGCRVLHFHL